MGRYSRLRYIQTLDPERDYEEIFALTTRYEFPWDYNTGYSFAFVTDFVIPTVTHELASTGQFAHHSMKRYDDTMLFPFDAHRHGLESGEGRATIRKLNKIHSHYGISNQDYLHILAGHLVCAVDWINAYGWRPLCDNEVRALVLTHRRLGQLMGIKDIPETYEQFKRWIDNDIEERGRWHYANSTMVGYVLGIIAGLCPPGTRALSTRAIVSLIDEPVRVMLDQPKMPAWFTAAVRWGLCSRGRALRFFPPRRRPYNRTPRSYPHGWSLEEMGPHYTRGGHHPAREPVGSPHRAPEQAGTSPRKAAR
ncbi:oxygenase MpaB family protein [Streptomyces noboritoensis]|uniref:Oxygenase MpaB family protein n=1 Tax=Streptomyces noboritoensis TaxID=67337 RepID=A0ABV6TGJ3_9ACTN